MNLRRVLGGVPAPMARAVGGRLDQRHPARAAAQVVVDLVVVQLPVHAADDQRDVLVGTASPSARRRRSPPWSPGCRRSIGSARWSARSAAGAAGPGTSAGGLGLLLRSRACRAPARGGDGQCPVDDVVLVAHHRVPRRPRIDVSGSTSSSERERRDSDPFEAWRASPAWSPASAHRCGRRWPSPGSTTPVSPCQSR